MFSASLALELLCVCDLAERARGIELATMLRPTSHFLNRGGNSEDEPVTVNGRAILMPTGITSGDWKSDCECLVARSEGGDVVVAFRGSETRFFDEEGAFKDWVLTDFRSNRIPYPPAPGSTGDKRWVHAGFWQAYNLLRNALLAEVGRQADKGSPAHRVYVTGFSMGGALALLAALDVANALPGTPVIVYTFAAPRAGDASLNGLLRQRVKESFSIGLRGDPIIHLPPLGPNFPVTFKHPIEIQIAGLHIPLGNPSIPQLWQHYQTADRIIYIDQDGKVHHRWPLWKVALDWREHSFGPYRDALFALDDADRLAEEEAASAPGQGRSEGVLQLMFSAAP